MLFNLVNNPLSLISYLLSLFIAISIHEFAHAWMADRLGDPTPELQGRLTLDPRAHIDLSGLLFLLFFGFGWGRPVQFDPFNLKNPRQDAALISIAGPISNFLLALLLSLVLRLIILVEPNIFSIIGQYILVPMIILNVTLGVFNLLPIHPLDGFKIVGGLLPRDQAEEWYGLERYGIIFLILIILPIFGNSSMLDMVLRPLTTTIINVMIPR